MICHAWLTDVIHQVHAASGQTQGQPAAARPAHLGRGNDVRRPPATWFQRQFARTGEGKLSWAVVLNACPRRLVGSLDRRHPTARAVGSWVANATTCRLVRMQLELLDRQRWRTRLELASAIVDDLDIVHNRQH